MTEIIGETRRLMPVIASAAGRRIALPGPLNLRDVGGYPTRDGGIVRWRVLLRSGALHRVGERGTAVLRELNLRTVIDLRTHVEAEISPGMPDDLGAQTLQISILGGDLQALPTELSGTYRHMVDECGGAIAAVVRRLCGPGALPALIHCSAGRDRTGVVVALILAAVGVCDEVIAADYALSGSYLYPGPAAAHPGQPVANPLPAAAGSRPELILDVLARARGRRRAVGDYLIRHGLDRGDLDRLHAALVEYPAAADVARRSPARDALATRGRLAAL